MKDAPGAGPAATPAAPGAGPTPSPMSTPQPNDGLKQAGRVDVQIARKKLEESLPKLSSESEEGRAVLKALSTLSAAFGKTEAKDEELIPAEVLSLLDGIKNQSPGAAVMAGKPPLQASAPAAAPM